MWSRSKTKKITGRGIANKHDKRTLTPGVEEQAALFVFCNIASSVPRLEWDGKKEECCFSKAFPELAL